MRGVLRRKKKGKSKPKKTDTCNIISNTYNWHSSIWNKQNI